MPGRNSRAKVRKGVHEMGRVSKRKASGKAGLEATAGKKNGKSYRAGIYARLSSDADEDKNESIDIQISIQKILWRNLTGNRMAGLRSWNAIVTLERQAAILNATDSCA